MKNASLLLVLGGVCLFLSLPLSTHAKTVVWVDEASESKLQISDSFKGAILRDAGDVNGDGFEDKMLVYDRWDDYLRARLLFGPFAVKDNNNYVPAEFVELTTNEEVEGPFMAGDINNDGFDDLYIYYLDTDLNIHYYYFLGADDLDQTNHMMDDAWFSIIVEEDWMGHSYYSWKDFDFNGDGYDDIIVDIDTSLYFFWGKDSYEGEKKLTDADFVIINETGSLDFPGDVNGDGYDDLSFWMLGDNQDASILYGGDYTEDLDLSTVTFDIQIQSNSHTSIFGADVNGDGHQDIIAERNPGTYTGRQVAIYFGPDFSASMALSDADTSIYSNEKTGELDILNIEDVNGDGITDIVLGAEDSYPKQVGSGSVLVYYGGEGWRKKERPKHVDLRFNGYRHTPIGEDPYAQSGFVVLPMKGKAKPGVLLFNDEREMYRYGFFPVDKDDDGQSMLNGDCNDSKKSIYQRSKKETTYDEIDNNCNGLTDEDYTFTQAKNGGVKSIQKHNYGSITVTYEDDKKQKIVVYGAKRKHVLRAKEAPDDKYIVTLPKTSKKQLRVVHAYTGRRVATKQLSVKNNNIPTLITNADGDKVYDIILTSRNNNKKKVTVHYYTFNASTKVLKLRDTEVQSVTEWVSLSSTLVSDDGVYTVRDGYKDALFTFTLEDHSIVVQ